MREVQTGAGPLDVMVIDTIGQVTLVECKVASNAQIRREIVGQVLDYASSLWRMPFAEFDGRWRQRHSDGLGVIDALGADGEEAGALESAISANLNAGRFNVVLAVDEINDGLRRIVQFLNDRTAPDLSIVAMELRYARHADVEILIPTVYGAELAAAKAAKSGVQGSWTEADVHEYLSSQWPQAAPIVSEIVDAFRMIPGVTYLGTGATTPSMIARWDGPTGVSWPFVIYTSKHPHIRVNFHWMTSLPAEAKAALAEKLSMIAGVTIDPEEIAAKGFTKRPAIDVMDVLASPAARRQFIDAVHDLLARSPSA